MGCGTCLIAPQLLEAKGNVREGVARQRDAPAGFTPDVLATFRPQPELIDLVALHPGLPSGCARRGFASILSPIAAIDHAAGT